ncbi:uncharacterized protein Z518_04516 [Rhinocladiella mackenziei CBS 650.93]|uniref:Autophagy-related protein 29 n=1 Tax=Rhinocladiella mackenziei CBS 650.93 TaxID=1442369 RepID=A0A0D2JBS2_9EURO|nr:uncharacterized protein Z518_04516 [Rhinocladiella mackenziei CBS 650.93]KIX06540.1 hypothetical protein Z518_04516 [Rhinocladiella mackenziei CBS 650.93]
MVDIENHFTVFIRLPFNRGNFVDPPPVAWSAAKERALWDIMSRQGKGNEIDWRSLSERFEVTQSFLLQQAAWLYERQLSQVRAQMRRVGNRQSATPSPAPGSVSASMVGGQAMKRAGSGGSRVPSRLSTQALGSPVTAGGGAGGGDSTPGTPAKSRTSLPFRSSSGAGGAITSQTRAASGSSRPLSRQSSKDADTPVYTTRSRRGSIQHQLARSPGQARNAHPQSSDSEDDMTQSRITARRPNPSSIHRRALSYRKDHHAQRGTTTNPTDPNQPPKQASDEDDDDDDSPSFLPFAAHSPTLPETKGRPSSSSQQDPGATLRGAFNCQQGAQAQNPRPNIHRRATSERISSPTVEPPTPVQTQRTRDLASTSPHSSPTHSSHPSNATRPNSTNQAPSTAARFSTSNPLSPSHRTLLPSSPRRHPGPGSDTSPSMGSSFSDLDDASVTQSALEEALLSGMGNTTMTMPGGGVAGRVSGISQALRSRYFDARGEGHGHGQRGGGGMGGVSER